MNRDSAVHGLDQRSRHLPVGCRSVNKNNPCCVSNESVKSVFIAASPNDLSFGYFVKFNCCLYHIGHAGRLHLSIQSSSLPLE